MLLLFNHDNWRQLVLLLDVILLLLVMLVGNLEGGRVIAHVHSRGIVAHVLVLVGAMIRLIIGQVVEKHVIAVPCTRFFHFMFSF